MLNYFVEQKQKDCFAACLYNCYDLLRPDVVMEISWRHGLMDFAMPYMIQTTRELMTKMDVLEKADKERAVKEEI